MLEVDLSSFFFSFEGRQRGCIILYKSFEFMVPFCWWWYIIQRLFLLWVRPRPTKPASETKRRRTLTTSLSKSTQIIRRLHWVVSRIISLPEDLPWNSGPEVMGAWGVKLGQILALTDRLDSPLRLQSPQSHHPKPSRIQARKAKKMARSFLCVEVRWAFQENSPLMLPLVLIQPSPPHSRKGEGCGRRPRGGRTYNWYTAFCVRSWMGLIHTIPITQLF